MGGRGLRRDVSESIVGRSVARIEAFCAQNVGRSVARIDAGGAAKLKHTKLNKKEAGFKLKSEFGQLKSDFGQLKSDFGQLKSDFGQLKPSKNGLMGDPSQLKSDFGQLKPSKTTLLGDFSQLKPSSKNSLLRDANHHQLKLSKTSETTNHQLKLSKTTKHMKLVRSRRLMKEYEELKKRQLKLKEPIFTVELVNDCLYEWKVKLRQVDEDSELHRDMQQLGIHHILLSITFPDNFPFQPPFLRVLSPRMEKGFVMEGGAICMELLTPRGWASAYTIEAVIMQFAASLVKGKGRICRKNKSTTNSKDFTKKSAESAFRSLVKTHDKYGWVTPPLAEG
ncbi:hypothetical protein Pmani_038263 [Petrolisthes manimaculis]|uniref:E2 ubiquitin-conjugating enzyme n=1 Tax=Petrolisthes manimaculis TaxID=1843537 RepID=A0AAE1TKK3_9EUCA|nr:hypothetical protein Pmani_038263 [Petrolisthes manimaculis]